MHKGVRQRPHVLVLESTWEDELQDRTSVRPYMEGWGDALGIRVAWRGYNTRQGLAHWLRVFFQARTNPSICYIAGHGEGRKLVDVCGGRFDVVSVLKETCPNLPGPARDGTKGKGLLLGACDVGTAAVRQEILDSTKSSLAWIAGYERTVPWHEATICDQLFLTYLLSGVARSLRKASL